MRTTFLLAAVVGLAACGAPEPFPAMVYFTVTTPDGVITKQATTFLAGAPKSNRSMVALSRASEAVQATGNRSIPMHLRNAPTGWMKSEGYGEGYRYPPDEPDAFVERLDIWRAEGRGEVRGVLHCYTGTLEFARRALDAELCVSFSGILTFKNDRGLREVARELPLDRLMVETDAPLLSPEGFRGRRNEPERVRLVGEALASTRGMPAAEVARITTANARRLFRLAAEAA